MHCRPHSFSRRAFTMIEIVLVLVIISTALALSAPSLRGWGQGAKLRDAGEQFVSAARWARAEAIATATPHRIELDSSAASYTVTRQLGSEYAAVTGELGRPTMLPQDYRLELASGGEDQVIAFYPNGRSTPAVVRITSSGGDTVEVACAFPADLFRVTPAGGAP